MSALPPPPMGGHKPQTMMSQQQQHQPPKQQQAIQPFGMQQQQQQSQPQHQLSGPPAAPKLSTQRTPLSSDIPVASSPNQIQKESPPSFFERFLIFLNISLNIMIFLTIVVLLFLAFAKHSQAEWPIAIREKLMSYFQAPVTITEDITEFATNAFENIDGAEMMNGGFGEVEAGDVYGDMMEAAEDAAEEFLNMGAEYGAGGEEL